MCMKSARYWLTSLYWLADPSQLWKATSISAPARPNPNFTRLQIPQASAPIMRHGTSPRRRRQIPRPGGQPKRTQHVYHRLRCNRPALLDIRLYLRLYFSQNQNRVHHSYKRNRRPRSHCHMAVDQPPPGCPRQTATESTKREIGELAIARQLENLPDSYFVVNGLLAGGGVIGPTDVFAVDTKTGKERLRPTGKVSFFLMVFPQTNPNSSSSL